MNEHIKMYTMIEVMLESSVINYIDEIVSSTKFRNYMIEHDKMVPEELDKALKTEVGQSMLRGKAIELLLLDMIERH